MEAAHTNLPVVDWAAPSGGHRGAARLFVPGEECVATLIDGTLPPTTVGGVSTVATVATTTTTTAPPTTVPGDTTPPTASPPTTRVPDTAIIEVNPSYTTVPSEVLDPRAPMPSTKTTEYVFLCEAPPPNVSIQEP
jgi:hypothetical protein